MIHDDLLFKYSDSELVEHLKLSEISLKIAKEKGLFNEDVVWRKKLRGLLPDNRLVVKHIKTGEDVLVSRRIAAIFLLMTMAYFSDQFFGFQDVLFDNFDGRLEFTRAGNNFVAFWPGNGKPGLCLNSISRMGAIYGLIVERKRFLWNKGKGQVVLGLELREIRILSL